MLRTCKAFEFVLLFLLLIGSVVEAKINHGRKLVNIEPPVLTKASLERPAPMNKPAKATNVPTLLPTLLPTSLPTELTIAASLDYGFFPEVTPGVPTQAEIDGVMEQTSKFYEQFLKARLPNLQSFKASFVSPAVFNPANPFPVRLNFKANLSFTTGKFPKK
jgi:hypothetical protein